MIETRGVYLFQINNTDSLLITVTNIRMKKNFTNTGDPGPVQEGNDIQKMRWVVTFDKEPSEKDDHFIKDYINKCRSSGDNIRAKRIKGKSSLVELWEFEGNSANIHTHTQKITAGVSSTNTHSEFNFEIDFKEDAHEEIDLTKFKFPSSGNRKSDPILIAVLDTGVKTDFIPKEYLWQHEGRYGKSFIKNGGEIEDDDKNLHGTLVSSFILNQFKDFPDYPVQIMNLKTHDENGKGDLFAIMDAICFAKKEGAAIINASWGFYQNEDISKSYLKDLITKTLYKKNIIFVTVSGNINPEIDEGNYFFPALFGKDISDKRKNIIVVTSLNTEGDKVSETQNSSSQWVDLGVPGDFSKVLDKKEYHLFELPFEKKNGAADSMTNNFSFISGTSFAAAIATGRIATFLSYKGSKRKGLGTIKKLIGTSGDLLFSNNKLLKKAIKGGRSLKRKSDFPEKKNSIADLLLYAICFFILCFSFLMLKKDSPNHSQ